MGQRNALVERRGLPSNTKSKSVRNIPMDTAPLLGIQANICLKVSSEKKT